MISSIGKTHERVKGADIPTPTSTLWTVEGCLHAGKREMARFLAEEIGCTFASLLSVSKEELAERLADWLNQHPPAAERAAKELPLVLGVTPRELEAALGCTRSERRRWVAEGRLPVCATMRMYLKAGKWVDVELVDRRAMAALEPGSLESWRAEHQQQVAERRRAGVIRGVERRAQTLSLHRQALQEITALQASWLERSGGDDPLIVAALTAAHWTSWASRRAKWHHEEAVYGQSEQEGGAPKKSSRRLPVRHWNQERRWYVYKDQALRLLYQTGWLRVRWYQPELLWIEELCGDHYDDWCEERSYLHTSFGEFVLQHTHELARCHDCIRDPNHYALYSLEFRPPVLHDESYQFHVPYSIGKAYLPDPSILSRVAETEASEGLFRFGRPLENEEVAKYSTPFVERHLTQALDELHLLLAGQLEEPR